MTALSVVGSVLSGVAQQALGEGGGYSTEALALFARFTTPPDATRKTLINNLIVALKAAGVWSKLDALYLTAAADSQAARRNWIADAFNLTAVSSPTFVADRGYTGDGSTSYLETSFNPSTASGKLVQDSATLFTWVRTEVAENRGDIGVTVTNVLQVQARRTAGEIDCEINNGSTGGLRTAVATSIGLSLGTRTANGARALYRNAGLIKSDTQASTGLNNDTISILANRAGGSYSTKQSAASGFGSGFTLQNVTDLYNALNTYLVAVGAA